MKLPPSRLVLMLALGVFTGCLLLIYSRVQTVSVETRMLRRTPTRRPELNICRNTFANDTSDRLRTYYCEGPAYDNFTDQLVPYVRALSTESSPWGRREFPLPADKTVFIIGNSHTGQVFNALHCQYESKIDWSKEHPDPFGRTEYIPSTWHFANNATIVLLINSPYVYHKDNWVGTIEKILDRNLSSFDAIVMGHFNAFETKSTFGKDLLKFSQEYGHLIDSNYTAPTIDRLSNIYSGPLVQMPMFAVGYGQYTKPMALKTIRDWQITANRSNIQLVDARKHIEALGNECGSNSKIGVSDCLPVERVAHRCMGLKGGHPDLVAWDLIEQLHALLE